MPVATPLDRFVDERLRKAATAQRARALAVAAVRETFEETGLMLAKPLKGGAPEEDFGEHWRGFLDKGMAPALDCLDLIARAVTPPGRPRRFNARFFMARAEDATGDIRHSSELGDIRWVQARRGARAAAADHHRADPGRDRPPGEGAARPQAAAQDPAVHHGASQAPDARGVAPWRRAPRSPRRPPRRAAGPGAASPGLPPRGGVRLRTLVLIRWAAVAGQLFTVAVVHWGLGFSLPLLAVGGAIALSALLNLTVSLGRPASARIDDREATIFLAFDILQLAVLLYLTGGLINPFSLLLLAPVAIGATILSLASNIALSLLTIISIAPARRSSISRCRGAARRPSCRRSTRPASGRASRSPRC